MNQKEDLAFQLLLKRGSGCYTEADNLLVKEQTFSLLWPSLVYLTNISSSPGNWTRPLEFKMIQLSVAVRNYSTCNTLIVHHLDKEPHGYEIQQKLLHFENKALLEFLTLA